MSKGQRARIAAPRPPQTLGGMRVNDNATDHPVHLRIFGCACGRNLFYARERAKSHRSIGWWRSSWVAGCWCDRAVRGPRLVVDPICSDAILPDAFLRRPRDLTYANLSCNLAAGAAIWVARTSCVRWHRNDDRPSA